MQTIDRFYVWLVVYIAVSLAVYGLFLATLPRT